MVRRVHGTTEEMWVVVIELAREDRSRTTFEETAPLMFPKEMTIPRVTDRLYEPSTLFETQAITFGMLE